MSLQYNNQATPIPRDVADIVYSYVGEQHVWAMTCSHYNAKYRQSVERDIDTKYIRNFARICRSCGRVDVAPVSPKDARTLCGYIIEQCRRNNYAMDDTFIGGIPINSIDITAPPVPVEYIAQQCRYYVDEHGLNMGSVYDGDPHPECDWVYLYSFDTRYTMKLVRRFLRGERYLFRQIIARVQPRKVAVHIQLWYNGLTHSSVRHLPLDENARQKIRDRMMSFGLGYTWHKFAV